VQWFDQYEIRARIVPTVVALSPLIFALFFILLVVSESVAASLGGVAGVALLMVYAFSFLTRYLGKQLERGLWARWDGAPTTRMLRWRDPTLDDETKLRLHTRVEQVSGITLSNREEEVVDPGEADKRISQSFVQVRATVRREDPEGLWSKHNAEYGFNRNLLGGKWLWLAFSVVGALACAAVWYFYDKDPLLVIGFVLDVVSILLAYIFGWHLLKRFARKAADRYAESVLGSFLVGADREEG
jgi:hypothetical protein